MRASRALSLLLALAVLSDVRLALVAAANAQPSHSVQKLGEQPLRLSYFPRSDVLLVLESGQNHVLWRSDNSGKSWNEIKVAGLPDRNNPNTLVQTLILHPFADNVAFLVTAGSVHYRSIDKGASWQTFNTPIPYSGLPFGFHADQPDWILYTGIKCTGDACRETYITRDMFKTEPALLLQYTSRCLFARSVVEFQATEPKMIYCTQVKSNSREKFRLAVSDLQFVASDNFFLSRNPPPITLDGKLGPDDAILGYGIVKKFLTIAILPKNGPDLDMWVSVNGKDWAMAQYPLDTKIKENGYTLLESQAYTLTVDVLTSVLKSPLSYISVGTLYTSNSNGTYFRQSLANTNRNGLGVVDVERVDGLEGTLLANKVVNWDDITRNDRPREGDKQVVTRISWDEGATWHRLVPPEKDANGKSYGCSSKDNEACSLHLHGPIDRRNEGKTHSTRSAPGLLMGIGNVGRTLNAYRDGDLFISTDGGVSWRCSRMGAHIYQSSNSGSIIMAVDDEVPDDKIYYSLDSGVSWTPYKLEQPVRASFLLADTDSLKPYFLLLGGIDASMRHKRHVVDKSIELDNHFVLNDDINTINLTTWHQQQEFHTSENNNVSSMARYQPVIIQIDVSTITSKCSDSSLEEWVPHALMKKENRQCTMGRQLKYQRRKSDQQCLFERNEIPQPKVESCTCTDDDYECDYNFIKDPKDHTKCELVGIDPLKPSNCPPGTTYKGSSGFRKIPGNSCTDGTKKDTLVERTCSEKSNTPSSGAIKHSVYKLDGKIGQIIQLPGLPVLMVKLEDTDQTLRSSDNGATWNSSISGVIRFIPHAHDPTRLYAVTKQQEVHVSVDQGGKFTKMNLPAPLFNSNEDPFDFHPDEKQWLLYKGLKSVSEGNTAVAYASKDDGITWSNQPIDNNVQRCQFSKDGTFTNVPKDMIFCTVVADVKSIAHNQSMFQAGNPELRSYAGFGDPSTRKTLLKDVLDYFVVEGFLAVATSIQGELHLMVSTDGSKFEEATFPVNRKMEKTAFTILNSAPNRVFLDVVQSMNAQQEYGALFISDETGSAFSISLDDTNRGKTYGTVVDFERVSSLGSVVIANKVSNSKELRTGAHTVKHLESLISLNDGGLWSPMMLSEKDLNDMPIHCDNNCRVHVHNRVTMPMQGGLMTGSSAPGLLMAVGNLGQSLYEPDDGHVFLSRNGGKTWLQVHDEPRMPILLDSGSILVLLNTKENTNVLKYSLDYGKNWVEYTYADRSAKLGAVVIDPTGARDKLVLYLVELEPSRSWSLAQVDFEGILGKKCVIQDNEGDVNDFERWALTDSMGVQCNLGRKIFYWRRKVDRQCHIAGQAQEPKEEGICECAREDFDCDTHYYRNEAGQCILMGPDPEKPAECSDGKTYIGKSGYRKISRSKCQSGLEYSRSVVKICGQENRPIVPGIQKRITELNDDMIRFFYFPQSDTVILLDGDFRAMQSKDAGKTWSPVNNDENLRFKALIQNPNFPEHGYLMGQGRDMLVTRDKGVSWQKMILPRDPTVTSSPLLSFHPDEPQWMIFFGAVDCSKPQFDACRTEALYTKDGGENWHPISTYVHSCLWARTKDFTLVSRNLVLCDIYRDRKGDQRDLETAQAPLQLYRSDDFFATSSLVLRDILGMSMTSEFLISAAVAISKQGLQLYTSLDAYNYQIAQFAPKLSTTNLGYTALISHKGTLFISVTVNDDQDANFGIIFRSDGSGANYSSSAENVNSNSRGYVDYERLQGVEGSILINRVANAEAVKQKKESKKLQTAITYDDGVTWSLLAPPNVDALGEKYNCKEASQCHLHLHSYTERRDPQNQFDSQSAPGLFLGVGNVAEYLAEYQESNVYVTRDGGRSWQEIVKGAHMYEFGNYGTLLVLVDDENPTTTIKYSTDQGRTIREFSIVDDDKPIRVQLIVTEPLSTSEKFLIFGERESDQVNVVIHIDFTGLERRICNNKDDYELWNPAGSADKCFFGHKVSYYRRKADTECAVGKDAPPFKEVTERCACVAADFECDFNFVSDGSGRCVPMFDNGVQNIQCDGKVYTVPSSYRKHPLSDCVGGLDLSKREERQCRNRLSGGTWAAIILVPFMVIGGGIIGYLHYRRGGDFRLPDWLARARTFRYVQLRTNDGGRRRSRKSSRRSHKRRKSALLFGGRNPFSLTGGRRKTRRTRRTSRKARKTFGGRRRRR